MSERLTLTASPGMQAAIARRAASVPAPETAAPAQEPATSSKQAKPPAPASKATKAEQGRARFRRAHNLLRARYPAIFNATRPLAVGMYGQVRRAISKDELSTRDLHHFFFVWTRRAAYRTALERGERRVNLDGTDAGPALAPEAAG